MASLSPLSLNLSREAWAPSSTTGDVVAPVIPEPFAYPAFLASTVPVHLNLPCWVDLLSWTYRLPSQAI